MTSDLLVWTYTTFSKQTGLKPFCGNPTHQSIWQINFSHIEWFNAVFSWMNYDVVRTIKYTKHQVLWYRVKPQRQDDGLQPSQGVTASAISWPTRPPTPSGTGNKYQPTCVDALRLRVKVSLVRYGLFDLWITVCVAGKNCVIAR